MINFNFLELQHMQQLVEKTPDCPFKYNLLARLQLAQALNDTAVAMRMNDARAQVANASKKEH